MINADQRLAEDIADVAEGRGRRGRDASEQTSAEYWFSRISAITQNFIIIGGALLTFSLFVGKPYAEEFIQDTVAETFTELRADLEAQGEETKKLIADTNDNIERVAENIQKSVTGIAEAEAETREQLSNSIEVGKMEREQLGQQLQVLQNIQENGQDATSEILKILRESPAIQVPPE